jgi:hypothetical protein
MPFTTGHHTPAGLCLKINSFIFCRYQCASYSTGLQKSSKALLPAKRKNRSISLKSRQEAVLCYT